MTLFSLESYTLHHKRAQKTFYEHSFLFDHVGDELIGRLQEIRRSFQNVLNLSPHPLPSFSSSTKCISASLGPQEAVRMAPWKQENNWGSEEASCDLILSCLHAHWVNDLPGFLIKIRRCLQAEGLFLGALWGGNTLFELRESLMQAEISLKGGASPRVAPMLQSKDAPLLLGRAGFKNPVVDTETLTVNYASLWALMKDLRGMGETNKLQDRVKTFTSSYLFEKAEEIYQKSFGGSESKFPATFEVIYLTGWGGEG